MPPTNKPTAFNINYLWWSLSIAILGGFAIGAHLASEIGFNFPLGKAFYSYIQLHGYLQLIGWAGLLIIGISLFFLPRLVGVPQKNSAVNSTILKLIVTGLIFRFLSQSVLAYLLESKFYYPVALISLGGAILVFCGIFLYVKTLIGMFPKTGILPKGISDIHIFFKMALLGWLIYPMLTCVLLVDMTLRQTATLNASWNEFATQAFIFLTLLPVAFAFSVRIFPLYLKLPLITWPVATLAKLYFAAVCVQLTPTLPPLGRLSSSLPQNISLIGAIFKSVLILYFVWKLGFFKQRQLPTQKPDLQDGNKFGKFHWLIYSAYGWLVLGAILEIFLATAFFFKVTIPISSDALRHIYLLGFITSLIFGVSVSLIPGFIRRKQIAKPSWVAMTFWLINFAAICRILPLILPPTLLGSKPFLGQIAFGLFGISGMLGMAALVVLALNFRRTAYSLS